METIPNEWVLIIPVMTVLRVGAFVVGVTTFLHSLFAATKRTPPHSLLFKLVVIALAFVGLWIAVDAYIYRADWSPLPATIVAPMLVFVLWRWYSGIHTWGLATNKLTDMKRRKQDNRLR